MRYGVASRQLLVWTYLVEVVGEYGIWAQSHQELAHAHGDFYWSVECLGYVVHMWQL